MTIDEQILDALSLLVQEGGRDKRQVIAGQGLFVTSDYWLQFAAKSSVACALQVDVAFLPFNPNTKEFGDLTQIMMPLSVTANRTYATTSLRVSQGYILAATMRDISSSDIQKGRTHGQLRLFRGQEGYLYGRYTTLISGYVTSYALVWNPSGIGSPIHDVLEGDPREYSSVQSAPAAGAEVSITVPTYTTWEIVSLIVSLVTDATVANRYVRLILDDGTNTLFESDAIAAQAASLTYTYNFGPGLTKSAAIVANQATNVIAPLKLRGAFRIRTTTANLQAGDQFGAPILTVREKLTN